MLFLENCFKLLGKKEMFLVISRVRWVVVVIRIVFKEKIELG